MELLTGPNLAALLTLPGVGAKRALALAHHYECWERLLRASHDDLVALVGERTAAAIVETMPVRPVTAPLPEGVRVVSIHDSHYPKRLSTIPDPPTLLWWTGTLPPEDLPLLAVVGTRTPNTFGATVAALAASEAARHGIATCSGLALGCDSIAHSATLDAGLPTWAVLGQGVSTLPERGERALLAQRILANGGGLICEVPPDTSVAAHLLTQRNRLQSGLSRAVFIAQTGLPGATKPAGTMHTARFAIEQRRSLAVATPPPHLIDDETLAGNVALTCDRGIDPDHLRATSEDLKQIIVARTPAADLCVRGVDDFALLWKGPFQP